MRRTSFRFTQCNNKYVLLRVIPSYEYEYSYRPSPPGLPYYCTRTLLLLYCTRTRTSISYAFPPLRSASPPFGPSWEESCVF